METEQLLNHKVLGQEFKDRLQRALEQEMSYAESREVMDILESKLSGEQLGRVAGDIAEFFTSGEAQWAVETPMPDRIAAQVLTRALGVRILSTYTCSTGYFAHLNQSMTAPTPGAACNVLATRQCDDQTHYHLEYDGHHIGLCVGMSGRYWEVMALLYGRGEGAKLAAAYWVKDSRRMQSYMSLKFFGA